MVDPQYIAGHHGDASGPHFQKLLLPSSGLIPGKVEFPHHRKEPPSVFQQPCGIHCILIALFILPAHGEGQGFLSYIFNPNSGLDHNFFLSPPFPFGRPVVKKAAWLFPLSSSGCLQSYSYYMLS